MAETDVIESIKSIIRDYDYYLDTGFERNAATIALQNIRSILGITGYQAGVERHNRGKED